MNRRYKSNKLSKKTKVETRKILPKNRKELTRTETHFDFKNRLHKHRSYDVHSVEEEEPHYSSPLDKSNSCVSH